MDGLQFQKQIRNTIKVLFQSMKHNFQQFKIQLILRNSSKESKNFRRLSNDFKKQLQNQQKETLNIIQLDKISKFRVNTSRPRNQLSPNLFLKDKQYKQFTNKCINLLTKKKINTNEEISNKKKIYGMIQNIKNSIKATQRKNKHEIEETHDLNEYIYGKNIQRLHQIYNHQDKIELYRMIRSKQDRRYKKQTIQSGQKQQKQSRNNQSQIKLHKDFVCFTMELNQHHNSKKNIFEVPIYRNNYVSNNKKTVQVFKNSQRSMSFQMSKEYDGQYLKKIKGFLDFLFKINFSNNIYVSLDLNKYDDSLNISKYKVFVGKGNNSLLIKGLLKRRFWWEIVQSSDHPDLNFCWTQNILEKVHKKQKTSQNILILQEKTKRKINNEVYALNKKILQPKKCQIVQKYIFNDGFKQPFQQTFKPDVITNHLPRNYCIGSKKNLFKSLFHYFTSIKLDPFDFVPRTYHIKSTKDEQYTRFLRQNGKQDDKVWIIKPGENTNRGNGIRLALFRNVNTFIKKSKHQNGQPFTYILQSYINKPFLYNNRKFDIRHYLLLTSINGSIKAYWYKDGYIRTSSQIYDLQDLDNKFIHLTNDAIQCLSQDYQKFQPANKLSYSEFQRYLDYTYPSKNYNLEKDILTKMKEISQHIIKANYKIIDHERNVNNFQIFGLDFMIDKDFKPWLIQVNYNPCLQVNCLVLERIIPSMVESSFRVALDPLFPPTSHYPPSKKFYLSDNYLKNIRYQLIFHEQSPANTNKTQYQFQDEKQQEEEYQNEGHQIQNLNI